MKKSLNEDSWHGSTDAWHGGDNAWSGEHDQWARESLETVPELTGVDEEDGLQDHSKKQLGRKKIMTQKHTRENSNNPVAVDSTSPMGGHTIEDTDLVAEAVVRRIIGCHARLIEQYGPDAVLEAAHMVSESALIGDLGVKTVSSLVRQVFEQLQSNAINEAKKMRASDDPCWKGYHMVGTKKKGGRSVPNCVPGQKGSANESVTEGRFDEPLTGWHIVYRKSGNIVHNTPSFETKEAAQKYLMTKMFANHQDFKVVHTAGVTEGSIGRLAAAGALAAGLGMAGYHLDQKADKVSIQGHMAYVVPEDHGKIPANALTLKGDDGKTYRVWMNRRKDVFAYPLEDTQRTDEQDMAEAYKDDGYGYKSLSVDEISKLIRSGNWEAMTDIKPGKHLQLRNTRNGKTTTIHVKEQGVAEEASPMIKPPANRFDTKAEAFAYAREHGGKVFRRVYTDPNTGNQQVSYVVKKES